MLSKIKNKSTRIINKVKRKKDEVPLRITSETIDVHRENVLSGGRKFKYPVQYAKHKLVYNAAIILVSVVIVFSVIVWWQLYKTQTSSNFFYRITRILPVPVAVIDGEYVPYKDYLMKYNSSVHYLENIEKIDLKSTDGKSQLGYMKKQSMHEAVLNAYARKILKENKLSIQSGEIDSLIKMQRLSSTGEVSSQTYNAVILEYYNWTEEEYRYAMENTLIKQTAAYFLDDQALNISKQIESTLKSGTSDLNAIVNDFNSKSSFKIEFMDSGLLPKNNNDGGLSSKAIDLQKGQIYNSFKPLAGDGYYFIKNIESTDTKIHYQYLKIPLTKFNDKVAELEKSNKVQYYININ